MTKIEAFKVLNLIEKVYPLVTLKSETILMWMAKCDSMDYSKVLNKLAVHIRSIPVRRIFGDLNEKEPSWYDTGCQIVQRIDP